MDRIARIGNQHHVARRRDRLRDIGEALLRAEGRDDLRLRVELDAEAPIVIGGLRPSQPGDPLGCRIAISPRPADGLLELLHDMGRGRQVGIAHAEIDDVGARIARGRLGAVHLLEDVRGQPTNAVELFHGLKALVAAALANRPNPGNL